MTDHVILNLVQTCLWIYVDQIFWKHSVRNGAEVNPTIEHLSLTKKQWIEGKQHFWKNLRNRPPKLVRTNFLWKNYVCP